MNRYRSAIDLRILLPLAVVVGWTYPAGFWLMARGNVPVGLILLIAGLLPLGIFLPVGYELRDEVLRVRSGLFRWQIPYALIVAVEPERSARAAPALARDRLAIEFFTGEGNERVLVSPRHRAAFLADLRGRAQQARFAGGLGAASSGDAASAGDPAQPPPDG